VRVFRYALRVRTPASGCRSFANSATITTTKQRTTRVVRVCRGYARPAQALAAFTG
jgi:hypothetical protein